MNKTLACYIFCFIPSMMLFGQLDQLPIPDTLEPVVSYPAGAPIIKPLGEPQTFFFDLHNTFVYDQNNNLPPGRISEIAVDHNERTWFVTDNNGFGFIDGESVYIYNETNGFHDRINHLYIDSKNNIWVGGNGSGVYCFDGKNVTPFYYDNGLGDVHIQKISEDHLGRIWVATRLGGISVIDNMEVVNLFTEEDGLNSNYIDDFICAKNGQTWIFSNGEVNLIENGKVSQTDFANKAKSQRLDVLKDHRSIDLAQDNDGIIWVSSRYGLYHLTKKGFARAPESTADKGLTYRECWDVTADHIGNIYFSSLGIIYKFNGSFYEIVSKPEDYQKLSPVFLHIDKSLRVWASTYNGLRVITNLELYRYANWQHFYFEKKPVFAYDHKIKKVMQYRYFHKSRKFYLNERTYPWEKEDRVDQGKSTFGWAVHINRNKWAMLDTNGLELKALAKQYNQLNIRKHSKINESYWAITYDDNDLYQLVDQKLEPTGLRFPTPPYLLNYSDEGLWIFEHYTGFGVYKNGNFNKIANFQVPPRTRPTSVLETPGGNKVISIWGDYLYLQQGDSFVQIKDGVAGKIITKGWQDKDGNCWYSSLGGGLTYFASGKAYTISTTDGLAHNYVRAFFEDSKGNIWIGTEGGVTKLELLNGEVNVRNQDDLFNKYKVVHLKSKEGWLSKTVNLINEDHRGNIWFNASGSHAMMYMQGNENRKQKPRIILKDMRLFGAVTNWSNDSLIEDVSYTVTGSIYNYPTNASFAHSQNNLTFDFIATNWNNPIGVQYSFYLKGQEKDWCEPTTVSKANYTNLDYGQYTLKIKAIAGEVESDIFEYSFEIRRPFWHTWWFRFLSVLVLFVAVMLIIKARTRKLKKRQEELEKTVEERTYEINTQKREIQKQHSQLQERNTEIMDSINYAQRIQNAMLPSQGMINKLLPNGFVYFSPKEAVSGDFYWIEEFEGEKGVKILLFAAVDCTGHGVPGSMVSLIGNNALNKCVQEYGLRKPSEILDKLNVLVEESFSKSDDEMQDGMDIALCSVCLSNKESEKIQLQYSGAYSPLAVVSNRKDLGCDTNILKHETEDVWLHEIKATKQPIGSHVKRGAFINHSLSLLKGETVYVYSDGFQDQFGGSDGKKLKSKNFKKLLISIAHKEAGEQQTSLQKYFNEWKGNYEQIDDVCVIGVTM